MVLVSGRSLNIVLPLHCSGTRILPTRPFDSSRCSAIVRTFDSKRHTCRIHIHL